MRSMGMLRNHFKIPFFNNAYSLIGVQAATSILGFIFWLFVTRTFSTSQIGLGTGIYSAVLLLTGLAELGFGDGLTYYLPRAKEPERLINAYFSLSGVAILLSVVVFVSGQSVFSPALEIIRRSPLSVGAFFLFTLLIHISMIQDNLFVADRVSKYSLYKNILANLLRLPVFAIILVTQEWSILISAAISFIVGTFLVGRQYHSRERNLHRFQIELDSQVWKPILGFSFGNYLMNTIVALPNTLLPLIVLNMLGAAANGYFYIAWMIASLLAVIGRSFGVSLFVESGRDLNSIKGNFIRSGIISTLLLVPSVSLIAIFSENILAIFGKAYALEATGAVTLFAISCIPLTFFGITVGVLKAQGKIKELLGLAVAFTGLHIGLTILFATGEGLLGVGKAVILARSFALIFALVFTFRNIINTNIAHLVQRLALHSSHLSTTFHAKTEK